MEKINSFKKWLLALLLAFALPAQAEVVMTDGMLVTYDPNETYIPSGVTGGSVDPTFSIGFIFTNPTYSTVFTLTAPDYLVGNLGWALSSLQDSYGLIHAAGNLVAGQSEEIWRRRFSAGI